MSTATATKTLRIDFLYLDLNNCIRCRATDATLLEAIELASPALAAMGVDIDMTRTHVTEAEQARQLGFITSPTIRVNGEDIAGELLESGCDSCTDTCACDGQVDCRDWSYQGQRSTEPPLGLIVEAILRAAAPHTAAGPRAADQQPPPSELSDSLSRYFAGSKGADTGQCCSTDTQADCCPADRKGTCCGDRLELELCACQS
jgi:glutaredoxin